MPEPFIPLLPGTLPPRTEAAAPSNAKTVPAAAAEGAFEVRVTASPDPSRSPDICAKPSVTLQRQGELVTGIRIQCGCGRVIDLACIY